MVFGDRYNYQINKCPNVETKLAFAEKTYPFYCVTVFLAYAVVVSLLVGFNFLGYIKYISNWRDVYKDIQMSTTIIALFCIPSVYWVGMTFKNAVFNKEKVCASSVSEAEISRFKNQILAGLATSGFISGNVCYEILFAEANSQHAFLNHYYFFTMSIAFSFGVSAIVVSTLILLCLGELSTANQKAYFVHTLRKAKLLIFVASLSCIFCWQGSILALSAVKYTGEKGGDLQSFIPGLFGLLALSQYYYGVKKTSDGILIDGRTVTAAAIVPSDVEGQDRKDKASQSHETELLNDNSTILNPLILERKSTMESFQVEKDDK